MISEKSPTFFALNLFALNLFALNLFALHFRLFKFSIGLGYFPTAESEQQ